MEKAGNVMIKTLFFLLFATISTMVPVFGTDNGQDIPWEKISNHDGIEVFRKEIPGSPVVAFKGQGIINSSFSKVASILLDVDRSTEWVDRLEEGRVLERVSDLEFTVYNHIGTPIVMKDRDFVILFKGEYSPSTKTFFLRLSSTTHPQAPKTSHIRGKIINSSYTLKYIDDDHCYLITEIHCDPEGSVAKWIVNMFQKDWPRNTIRSIRKQAKKDDIKENSTILKLISETNELTQSAN